MPGSEQEDYLMDLLMAAAEEAQTEKKGGKAKKKKAKKYTETDKLLEALGGKEPVEKKPGEKIPEKKIPARPIRELRLSSSAEEKILRDRIATLNSAIQHLKQYEEKKALALEYRIKKLQQTRGREAVEEEEKRLENLLGQEREKIKQLVSKGRLVKEGLLVDKADLENVEKEVAAELAKISEAEKEILAEEKELAFLEKQVSEEKQQLGALKGIGPLMAPLTMRDLGLAAFGAFLGVCVQFAFVDIPYTTSLLADHQVPAVLAATWFVSWVLIYKTRYPEPKPSLLFGFLPLHCLFVFMVAVLVSWITLLLIGTLAFDTPLYSAFKMVSVTSLGAAIGAIYVDTLRG